MLPHLTLMINNPSLRRTRRISKTTEIIETGTVREKENVKRKGIGKESERGNANVSGTESAAIREVEVEATIEREGEAGIMDERATEGLQHLLLPKREIVVTTTEIIIRGKTITRKFHFKDKPQI